MRRAIVPVIWLWALALGSVLGGCALRDDPGYNRYATGNGAPDLGREVQAVMDGAQRMLDEADVIVENALY